MNQHYYLVSSLPMLEFGMKMPFPYSDFLSRCQEQLSLKDMEVIRRVSISPFEDAEDSSPILREWKRFDITLRNELARARAVKSAKDPLLFIRGEDYKDPLIAGFAHWVVNQESPLQAEISLDRLKWERIEELGKWHYFDIDCLITYALKLLILERWERINVADGMEKMQALISTF